MTDPLQALESLVEKWGDWFDFDPKRELEPIIQQLKDSMAAMGPTDDEARAMLRDALAEVESLRAERDVLGEHVKAHAMHARSLSDTLRLTGAEVESLRAERERYREAIEVTARALRISASGQGNPDTASALRMADAALQASSPKDSDPRTLANIERNALAKDSDTPEKEPKWKSANVRVIACRFLPAAPTPRHTQPSDTEEP